MSQMSPTGRDFPAKVCQMAFSKCRRPRKCRKSRPVEPQNAVHRPRWIFDAWFPVVSWGPPAVSHGLLSGSDLSPTRGIWPSCFWLITEISGDFFTDKHKNLKKNIKKFGEMKKVRIFAARFRNDRWSQSAERTEMIWSLFSPRTKRTSESSGVTFR